ncbi:15594_t:CDS:2, partial [Gigaspora rosea]
METDGSNVVVGDEIQELESKIKLQGEKVRALKSLKTDQGTVDAEIATPLDLKKQLASITGEDGSAKSKSKFTLKNSKGRASSNLDVLGTCDYKEKEMAICKKVFSTIVSVFKKHSAVTIILRFLKLKEILSGKYSEDSKLNDLNDQGGEKCSLQYDLTVPFTQFLAMNSSQYQNIKRYQIAK